MPTRLEMPRQRAASAAAEPPISRLLESLAGFFRQEADAQRALQLLVRGHGLSGRQVQLLSPADASPHRFARAAALWAPRWSVHGSRQGRIELGLTMSLLALLIVSAAWWLAPDSAEIAWGWLPVGWAAIVALLAGGLALAGRWLPGLLGPPRRLRRFETVVHQQLVEGHWVLVVHGVPWGQQTEVLALMRRHSQRWCAVAPEQQPLG